MQNGVDITIKEQDLKIKYGLFNIREERELARTSVKYIYTDCCDIQRSYIRLGFHLNEFKNYLYFEDFGFATFEDFCSANLGMDKSAVSRCLNVFLRFAQKNENSNIRLMYLDDKYTNYNYSQLCEMLSLDDEEIKDIKPDMTIKQIREYKKSKKVSAKKDDVIDVTPVATSQPKLCSNDFCTKKGIVLQNHIAKCSPVKSVRIDFFDSSGKRLDIKTYDVLLSGSLDFNTDTLVLREIKEDKPTE